MTNGLAYFAEVTAMVRTRLGHSNLGICFKYLQWVTVIFVQSKRFCCWTRQNGTKFGRNQQVEFEKIFQTLKSLLSTIAYHKISRVSLGGLIPPFECFSHYATPTPECWRRFSFNKISFLECGPKDDALTTCQTSVSRMTVRQKVF